MPSSALKKKKRNGGIDQGVKYINFVGAGTRPSNIEYQTETQKLGEKLSAQLVHDNFFFIVTATTEIYTLSLHDALPISASQLGRTKRRPRARPRHPRFQVSPRSEEHTSELQSRRDLVCRLLLAKKK